MVVLTKVIGYECQKITLKINVSKMKGTGYHQFTKRRKKREREKRTQNIWKDERKMGAAILLIVSQVSHQVIKYFQIELVSI
jgi:hypothetical protein